MAIERQHGEVIFICDECDDTCETGERDFETALAIAKSEGWLTMREGDDWTHICPTCVGDDIDE